MATIQVFDPPMCCSTGVCGPTVDPELARFAADVEWLQKQGGTVERFNLSQQPGAFADTSVVKEALVRGTEVLPIVLVDGRIAVEGAYPSRETLAALAGVVVRKVEAQSPPKAACCSPSPADKASSKTDAQGATKTGCC
jgi:hypothetical protein